MKKTFLSLLLAASTFSAYGQELLEGAKFFDNWSFGVKGGVITPLNPTGTVSASAPYRKENNKLLPARRAAAFSPYSATLH